MGEGEHVNHEGATAAAEEQEQLWGTPGKLGRKQDVVVVLETTGAAVVVEICCIPPCFEYFILVLRWDILHPNHSISSRKLIWTLIQNHNPLPDWTDVPGNRGEIIAPPACLGAGKLRVALLFELSLFEDVVHVDVGVRFAESGPVLPLDPQPVGEGEIENLFGVLVDTVLDVVGVLAILSQLVVGRFGSRPGSVRPVVRVTGGWAGGKALGRITIHCKDGQLSKS